MTNIIGVDVDDVTADLTTAWVYEYNKDYGDNLKISDIKTWHMHDFAKHGMKIYDYLKTPKLYDSVFPVLGSKDGVSILRNGGYRVVFITATHPGQEGRKYQWLVEHGFLDEGNKEDYIEAKDKSLVAVNFLIDDNPNNVIYAYDRAIVFDKPWNESLSDSYPRVYSWDDIVKYFGLAGRIL